MKRSSRHIFNGIFDANFVEMSSRTTTKIIVMELVRNVGKPAAGSVDSDLFSQRKDESNQRIFIYVKWTSMIYSTNSLSMYH